MFILLSFIFLTLIATIIIFLLKKVTFKKKIITDLDIFYKFNPEILSITITGTNGKSTTVALLSHIIKFNNLKCVVGGNYGYPACLINDPGREGVIILELSSYQLDSSKTLSLDLASILKIML